MNATMGLSSPTSFDAGGYGITQNNTGLDITRYFANALQGTNVAFGAQYRVENYTLNAGELNSYLKADQRQIYNLDTTTGKSNTECGRDDGTQQHIAGLAGLPGRYTRKCC